MQVGKDRGDHWREGLNGWLAQQHDLETAADGVHGVLDELPDWDESLADALFAGWLGGQWQGEGSLQADGLDPYNLPPREAIQFFERKKVVTAEEFAAEQDHYKSQVFTLGRVADRYVADHVHAQIVQTLKDGSTLKDFLEHMDDHLAELGVKSPGDYYWELVFRNGIQNAYMAGRHRQQMRVTATRPFWRYVAIMDKRTRPAHRAFHGTLLRFDDPFWATHYPPNGHKCRCRVVSVSQKELTRDKLQVTPTDEVPELWPDPGFKSNPGARTQAEKQAREMVRKVRQVPGLKQAGADLSRMETPARVEALDEALGLSREQQTELLGEASRIKTGGDGQSPEAGQTWVEWSHFTQDSESLKLAITRLLQDPRFWPLAKRLSLDVQTGMQAGWQPDWRNPQVVVDQLGGGAVGKFSQYRLRAAVQGDELQLLTDFWREVGQLQPNGFVASTPLPGAWEQMDLVIRGQANTPEGCARATRNTKTVDGKRVEALTREPLDGWEHEPVFVNQRLYETL